MIPVAEEIERAHQPNDPLDAIQRVVAAFERSDWSEIDVRTGDLRVHLAARAPTPDTAVPDGHGPGDGVDLGAPGEGGHAMTGSSNRPSAPDNVRVVPPAGCHVVVSPSPGIFWRAPEPGAPAFAEVGDVLDESATVCIVEVMKLMNHVKAGVSGEVVAVYGDNGVAVGRGTPLFAIAPAGSPP